MPTNLEHATELLIEFQRLWSDPPLDVMQFDILANMIATNMMSPGEIDEASNPDKARRRK